MQTKSIIGNRYNRLTVISKNYDKKCKNKYVEYYNCKCDCGNHTVVSKSNLTLNKVKSCGCLRKEKSSINGKANKRYNTYDLTGEFGIGYTLSGEEFYFDLEDYNKIKDYCWWFDKQYPVAKIPNSDDKKIYMHNLVMNNNSDILLIDHINHIVYDNKKNNLRFVTISQNNMNKKKMENNTSGVTGVFWHKRDCIWEAQIGLNGKNIYLGRYIDFSNAVKARKDAEEKYFGEYSYDTSINNLKTTNI